MSVEKHDAPGDASAGPGTGNGREIKLGRMLESLIERGGYSRNRKRITSRWGISSAALSQYIRQQTWPSFTKLLAIADFFDVSLDYLVYGEPAAGSLVDYGPLYRYFDHALADVQARVAGIVRRCCAHRADAGGSDRRSCGGGTGRDASRGARRPHAR